MPKQNKQINRGKKLLHEDDMDIISRLAALSPKRLKMFLSAFVFFVIALSICGFYIISKQASSHHYMLDYVLDESYYRSKHTTLEEA